MSNSVKDRIATDLRKAKSEGSLRAERVKDIVKAAVSQAMSEVKEGSFEIRTVVQDVIAAVVESVGDKGRESQEEITASVEGAIEGVSQSRREEIAKTQAKIDELQAQMVTQEQQLDAEVEGAIVQVETSDNTSPDLKEFAGLREQYARLRTKLEVVEANLKIRYGDRYDEVKQHLDNAKTWYDNAKVKAETKGIDPIQEKQQEFETKLGEAGAALAHKEEQVKQRLKELWKTVTKM
jgi:F0F1-type ATP synthase membrane subunit b/b'